MSDPFLEEHEGLYDTLKTLKSFGVLKTYPKNELIQIPGQVCRKLFFLEKGIMRAYRLSDGHEVTHYFYTENWFATDYLSFLKETSSELYIQTLSEVTLIEFSKSMLVELYQKNIDYANLGRILAEQAYLITVDRVKDLQTKSLSEKYSKLLNTHSKLINAVPQKYIASYLGVAEPSLSRIKSKYKKN